MWWDKERSNLAAECCAASVEGLGPHKLRKQGRLPGGKKERKKEIEVTESCPTLRPHEL